MLLFPKVNRLLNKLQEKFYSKYENKDFAEINTNNDTKETMFDFLIIYVTLIYIKKYLFFIL